MRSSLSLGTSSSSKGSASIRSSSWRSGESASVSSNGFAGTAEGDYAGYSTSVTVREDADKRPEGSYYAVGRFLNQLPGPEEIAREALKRALKPHQVVAFSGGEAAMAWLTEEDGRLGLLAVVAAVGLPIEEVACAEAVCSLRKKNANNGVGVYNE